MLFWIIIALILLGTLFFLLRPFIILPSFTDSQLDPAICDVLALKEQLRALETDFDRTRLNAQEADLAHVEIGRRLLQADAIVQQRNTKNNAKIRARNLACTPVDGAAKIWSLSLFTLIPALSIGIYLLLGYPHMRDYFPKAISKEAQHQNANQIEDIKSDSEIRAMVEGLAARLEDDPQDKAGWFRLIRAYQVLERFDDLMGALDNALKVFPDTPDFILLKARLLRSRAGNQTTEETVALMQRVLAIDENNLEALWFTGLDAVRRGEDDLARKFFERALSQLPEGSEAWQNLNAQKEKWLSEQSPR